CRKTVQPARPPRETGSRAPPRFFHLGKIRPHFPPRPGAIFFRRPRPPQRASAESVPTLWPLHPRTDSVQIHRRVPHHQFLSPVVALKRSPSALPNMIFLSGNLYKISPAE